jgi:beta-glucosidase
MPRLRAASLAITLAAVAALGVTQSCLRPPAVPARAEHQTVAVANEPTTVGVRPFRNPELEIEERIDDLLARLTIEEKVEILSTDPSVPRLGIVGSDHVEGLHGLALGGPGHWGRNDPITTTTFPQAVGLANTWDPGLVRQAAAVEAREARWAFHVLGRGGIVVRAPNADLARDPRWGRGEESYGEDPFLASRMAVAFVRGLQGDHPKYIQAASLLKHFVANTNEDGRGHTSSDFDERLFHEYYAAAFRAAIREGGARAFMAAYNAHNGIPCTTHPMLQQITVQRWGQNGIICTDAGALRNLLTRHKQFTELPRAAAAALKAGISQFLDRYRSAVDRALHRGLLSEADLDRAVRQNYRVMIRLGLLDPPAEVPYAQVDAEREPWTTEKHRALARLVTQRSIVLLENEDDFLPLTAERLKSVAVIGPHADTVHLDWYSGTPPYAVSPLEGVRNRLGGHTKVVHASGDDEREAIQAAKSADVVLVVVGNHPTGDAGWAQVARPSYGKEAVDRKSITLEDEALIQTVYQHNRKTVVVLLASFPYAINWTAEHVPAIVHLTHNSQELGTALADVLFGDVNPAGRLVQTWPRALGDLPPMMDYDIRHGRTYQYFERQPLYPFGYGLSYTSFAYSNLRTSAETIPPTGALTISVDVQNTGRRTGDEVVQLYVRRLRSRVARPRQKLEGFARVEIAAGQKRTVELELTARQLAHWDSKHQRFVVESGEVELRVGRSSAGIELTKMVRVVE